MRYEIITVKTQRREDGGLQVYGEPPGGLILSGADPEQVIVKIWPTLLALKAEPRARNPEIPHRIDRSKPMSPCIKCGSADEGTLIRGCWDE